MLEYTDMACLENFFSFGQCGTIFDHDKIKLHLSLSLRRTRDYGLTGQQTGGGGQHGGGGWQHTGSRGQHGTGGGGGQHGNAAAVWVFSGIPSFRSDFKKMAYVSNMAALEHNKEVLEERHMGMQKHHRQPAVIEVLLRMAVVSAGKRNPASAALVPLL
ncbi:unnamed protein product [Angiostrongylus costaricensis]|uniref:'chromo' domain containing protein n=1 Tax=Angiostrongylus costaricensis TaxID=334426 RepID=A0A158PJW3_ANGCS|nr:unnamed protein product [Angiostrongylus costaricensis]